MEFLGSGLCLPINDNSNQIIDKTLIIYKRWLGIPIPLVKVSIPNVTKEERQDFYSKIIIQLSSVFSRQGKASKGTTEKHYVFCKEISRIFEYMRNELRMYLSESTWNLLLQVNIELAHKLLTDPDTTNQNSEHLGQVFVDSIFESLLRFGCQNNDPLSYFTFYASNWLHKGVVIDTWSRYCKGLTRRLLTIIYSVDSNITPKLLKSNQANSDICVNFLKNQVNYVVVKGFGNIEAKIFTVSDDLVIYLWLKFLFLFDKRVRAESNQGTSFNTIESYKLFASEVTNTLKEFNLADKKLKSLNDEIGYTEEEVIRGMKTVAFKAQNEELGKDIAEYLAEIRKNSLLQPNGHIILKLFGTILFRTFLENLGSFDNEKIICSELGRMLTNMPGPFSYTVIAWFYYHLQNFMVTHKEKLYCTIDLVLSCSELFASNLYGVRILRSNFNDYLRDVLTNSDPNKIYSRVITCTLKVVSQLIASCNAFTGFSALKMIILKDKEDVVAQSYLEIQKELTFLLDWRIQEKKLPAYYLLPFLWVSALNILQNKSSIEYLNFINTIINNYLVEGFDENIVDDSKISVMLECLDIIEMLFTDIKVDAVVLIRIPPILEKLMLLADTKLPIEGTTVFKKIQSIKKEQYERVLLRIIYVCLMILNTSSLLSSYLITRSLFNIIIKSYKGFMSDRTGRLFDYTKILNNANFALNWIIAHTQNNKVFTLQPNIDTALCKDNPNLFDTSIPKIHLIQKDDLSIISLYELKAKKYSYDYLILIRNGFGQHAYNAKLLSNFDWPKETETVSVEEAIKMEKKGELINEEKISEIIMSEEERVSEEELEAILKLEMEKEASSINERQNVDVIESEYESSLVNTSNNTLARFFFNHFQLISEKNGEKVCTMKNTKELAEDMKALDSISNRYLQIIPILYYKSSISSYEENYEDQYFKEITSELGVSLEDKDLETGNFGNIANLIKDVTVIYNPSVFYEQAFLIPSIQLNNKEVNFCKGNLENRKNNSRCKDSDNMECKSIKSL